MLKKHFFSIIVLNIVTIYLLILAGGIVRSTGSGMGCPDWPKCFGSYIPPTSADALPADYKDIYLNKRLAKNERLSKMLIGVGYTVLADRLINEEIVSRQHEFNASKTWIEYVNRLIGALLGLFLILLVASSLGYFRTHPSLFFVSFISLLLTVFQGWVGSIVVSSNLLPGLITFHMLLAIVIMALLIWIFYEAYTIKYDAKVKRLESRGLFIYLAIFALVLQFVQVGFGSQVREAVDYLTHHLGNIAKYDWLTKIGVKFEIHRSFSWLILFTNGFLIYKILKSQQLGRNEKFMAKNLFVFLFVEVFAGIGMAYGGIPPYLQPVHLLFATLIFGLQVFLFLTFKFARQNSI